MCETTLAQKFTVDVVCATMCASYDAKNAERALLIPVASIPFQRGTSRIQAVLAAVKFNARTSFIKVEMVFETRAIRQKLSLIHI